VESSQRPQTRDLIDPPGPSRPVVNFLKQHDVGVRRSYQISDPLQIVDCGGILASVNVENERSG
jgi:hypothetical protein